MRDSDDQKSSLSQMCSKGFEPPTHGLEGRCSIQLSYEHISVCYLHQRTDEAYCNLSDIICQQFCINFLKIKMSTLNSTFFHIFIVLPFCTIRSLFYCIFSLLGSAIVRLPLLPASHAPYFRSYASCFTSSSNSSPAE